MSTTEHIDSELQDLDLRSSADILSLLLKDQLAAVETLHRSMAAIEAAVSIAAETLGAGHGRLVLVGAGASGRLAVQDGAELWPTYGWPPERLLLVMAGGDKALTQSVEGVEDDAQLAGEQVRSFTLDHQDVVVALAASGRSPWTVAWLEQARAAGAVTIGAANNPSTPLLEVAEYPVLLASGSEVLAGSTRMGAGTAQKVFLNLFSTCLMIRLNRTYGNLMVDMAAVNHKLDQRRVRMLQQVIPDTTPEQAQHALAAAGGWVKLAALIRTGLSAAQGRALLDEHAGSLRAALQTRKHTDNSG